jgi:hypothetical protein
LKLSHTAYDIEALGILFKHGEWGVEVTIECLENVAEKKNQFGLPYGMFRSQGDAESWACLPRRPIGSMLASRTLIFWRFLRHNADVTVAPGHALAR